MSLQSNSSGGWPSTSPWPIEGRKTMSHPPSFGTDLIANEAEQNESLPESRFDLKRRQPTACLPCFLRKKRRKKPQSVSSRKAIYQAKNEKNPIGIRFPTGNAVTTSSIAYWHPASPLSMEPMGRNGNSYPKNMEKKRMRLGERTRFFAKRFDIFLQNTVRK